MMGSTNPIAERSQFQLEKAFVQWNTRMSINVKSLSNSERKNR